MRGVRVMTIFTGSKVNPIKGYGGANGNKINVMYNNVEYMLKFPPTPASKARSEESYTNGCISEYLGCKIFESLGFVTQQTLLGEYVNEKGKKSIVVACEDFTFPNKKLIDFIMVKNTCLESSSNGAGTEITTILDAIEEQQFIDPVRLKNFFWEMFIADALLGNFDRHNGNWGFLVDEAKGSVELAPIYDCGSCLYPQLKDADMSAILDNKDEIEQRVYVFPNSMIKKDGKKINYFDFISSLEYIDCTEALVRISKKIDMAAINSIIDKTPYIGSTQKLFYKTMLKERKEKIIDFSVGKL